MDDKTKRLSVYLPDKAKRDLERMSNETGLSMTQLIVMATHGLLANYGSRGGAVFADLVSAKPGAIAEKAASQRAEIAGIERYYGARANEYESVYERDDPNVQQELAVLQSVLKTLVKDRRVLEVACGTGFWSRIAAEAAAYLVGTDVRPEVLELAKEKRIPPDRAEFVLGDAYQLDRVNGSFDFGLANFWLSHVPKNRIDDFLTGFHRRLGPGSRVFMADNVYVAGRGGELLSKPDCEDTYKLRVLADGSRHEVLKNYYTYEELKELFEPYSERLTIFVGSSYWYVTYTIR